MSCDDRGPNPDGQLTLLDVPIEVLLPRSVAGDFCRVGVLPLDEQRVPI